jgi:hypothetical protein
VWLIIELVVIMLSLYIMNVNTSLKYTDVIAYCGYTNNVPFIYRLKLYALFINGKNETALYRQ